MLPGSSANASRSMAGVGVFNAGESLSSEPARCRSLIRKWPGRTSRSLPGLGITTSVRGRNLSVAGERREHDLSRLE